MKIKELFEKRNGLLKQMRDFNDAIGTRGYTAEEQAKYDAMEADYRSLDARIQRESELAERESRMNQSQGTIAQFGVQTVAEGNTNDASHNRNEFRSFLLHGKTPEYRGTFYNATTTAEGAALVNPELYGTIVEGLQAESKMRKLGTVINSSKGRILVPTYDSAAKASLVLEEGTITTNSPAGFGSVSINAYKWVCEDALSIELIQDAAFDVEAFIQKTHVAKTARAEDQYFITGTGTNQPHGVVGSSTLGKAAASATAITFDELMDVYAALPEPYRTSASFLMNDGTASLLRKLKSAVDGHYIWQPGVNGAPSDRLLGRPVVISSEMPNVAANAKPVLFGDFSFYFILSVNEVMIMKLMEKHFSTGHIGYGTISRSGGRLTNTSAVKHLVMDDGV